MKKMERAQKIEPVRKLERPQKSDHRVKFLTQEEVAEWLHVTVSALTNMRAKVVKDPIPFVKVGRQVLYPEHLVVKWLERHTFNSTREYFESKTG